jgi:transposase
MPPSVKDWLPEGDLAWFLLDAVGEMDLEPFRERYRADGNGRPAYDPQMMVGLLLYAYCMGERSSRKIERLCERDVAFRVLAANRAPDHATVARFRQEHEKALEGLFAQVLRLCAQAGLVKVGVVALDGTKIKANASLAANRTYESLKEEAHRMLSEAAAKDAEEDARYGKDRRGDELPPELRDPKSRLARLKECKERLEREAREKASAQEEKIQRREETEAETGRKTRGRKPTEPDPTPPETAKANVTDPESRILKTRTGYVQGYNAQAVVTADQVIVAAEVTQEANDVKQLKPMLEKAREELVTAGVQGEIGTTLADAGYWSEQNAAWAEGEELDLLVATTKDWKQRKALRERPPPRGRIPKEATRRDRMERKLLTKRGRELYPLRSQTVEPVFGQVKTCRGCDRFQRRGTQAVRSEWKLLCATHNLLKLWRHGRASLN